eukprot:260313_1
MDCDKESQRYENDKGLQSYELPDGQQIHIGDEMFKCVEMMFTPSLYDKQQTKGMDELCYQSITKSPKEIQDNLRQNILLCGGNTMFKNMNHRLNQGMNVLFDD